MAKRIYYLDNLKSAATLLVILHHTAITYGASGSWYLYDGGQDIFSKVVLTLFTVVNQSFFMGLFFFISGYFTPYSYDRKGFRQFLIDRFFRLTVPLMIYLFFLSPVLVYLTQPNSGITFTAFYLQKLSTLELNSGPMWYLAALLYFSIVYAILRKSGIRINNKYLYPSTLTIITFAIVVGLVAFIIRLFVPLGKEIFGQQIGFFSSYIFLFIAGALSYRNKWTDNLKRERLFFWLRITFVCIIIQPVIFILSTLLKVPEDSFLGGFNFLSLMYALWEPLTGFGIVIILLTLFKDKFNKTNSLFTTLSRSAYTAYIIHPLILILVSLFLFGVPLPSIVKFILVGSISSLIIFFLAIIIRKLPGVKNVL